MGLMDWFMSPIQTALNWGIAQDNLAHQENTLEQQIALQREAWSREDNAVQRRSADLRAAGFNPILAAGGAAAAQGPSQLNAPQRSQMQMPQINSIQAVEALRTSIAQRDLISAQAEEHRARAMSIGKGMEFDVESWQVRLDTLVGNLEILGERQTVLQLEQENLRLRNEHQVSSNVIREVEAAVSEATVNAQLTELEQKVLALEVQNEILRMDADRRNNLGIPHSGSLAEKAFIWIFDRAREGAEVIRDNTPARVRSDIENYYRTRGRGSTY